MAAKKVIIIGAGIGGLATAIRLRALGGYDVTLLEKNPLVGGRAYRMEDSGFQFDIGPSLLLMTDVYRELFDVAGESFDDWLKLVKMEPNYRVHFGDGSELEMSSDLPTMIANLEKIEPGVAPRYYAFLQDACHKYRLGRAEFVEKNFIKPTDFFTLRNLGMLNKLGALSSLYGHVSKFFKDDRLRQCFSMQTMYLGISPFTAPAVYTLLPYTELAEDGLYFPVGGIYKLPEAMAAVARKIGVEIETGIEVKSILVEGGRARGVSLEGKGHLLADVIVSNADLPYTYTDLLAERPTKLAEERWKRDKFTCSAFNLYLGTSKTYTDELLHHNFFLTNTYKQSFDDLFERKQIPDEPAYYINAPTRTDPSLAPAGKDNLFVLVPVPHMTETLTWHDDQTARFTDKMLGILERRGLTGLKDATVVQHTYTPRKWRDQFNLKYGAAFGLSHGLKQVGYFRPANKAPHIDGLYFVGASTTPGTGVPLVCLGARLTAQRILDDEPSGSASGVRRV